MVHLSLEIDLIIQHLREGVFERADIDYLEGHDAFATLAELRRKFSLIVQERNIGKKSEYLLTNRIRSNLMGIPANGAAYDPATQARVESFGTTECIALSIEDNRITGISRMAKLRARPVADSAPRSWRIRSGYGFKLQRAPDGWSLERLPTKSVDLTDAFLQSRGWQFNQLGQFVAGGLKPPAGN